MMKRTFFIGSLILLLSIAVLAGCGLLETEEAGEPISAIPLTEEDQTAEAEADAERELEADVESEPGEEAEQEAESGSDDEAEIGDEADDSGDTEPESGVESGGEPTIFEIAQDESQVRFELDEVLRGQPKTVVGISNQVAGQIGIDFDDPALTELGIIQINARTLETDADRRNQAIRRFILQTDDHEFITFTPTAIAGLPDSITYGQSYPVTIAGDLTIRDITNEVTFEATITPVSESRLEGSAMTTINRADYNLNIPSVPFVADVEEEVLLVIEFVSVPV
jgi:polyisoprenoid-binding protein YceI